MDIARTWIVGAVVTGVHVAALLLLVRSAPVTVSRTEVPVGVATLIENKESLDTVPLPEVSMKTPEIDSPGLVNIYFEYPEEAAGAVAPVSAPRLDTSFKIDGQQYARQAGLYPGKAVTIILLIEVGTDGIASVLRVETSKGSEIDAAAVAYVRALRWIPGSIQGRPSPMRIRFPVVLAPMV